MFLSVVQVDSGRPRISVRPIGSHLEGAQGHTLDPESYCRQLSRTKEFACLLLAKMLKLFQGEVS